MPHEIRLAGPWEFSADDSSAWDRCSLPFDAASQCELNGETLVRIRRRFHSPSGLNRSSIVSIIVVANGEVARITLNDCDIVASTIERAAEQPISVTSHFRVSERLNEFNTLQMTLAVKNQSQASAVGATLLRIEDD
jgi:hypothetical protein